MNEGRLIERHIPKNLVKHNRKAYILPLEPDEYLTYTQTGELPPRKANHPLTWAKAPDEAGDTRQKRRVRKSLKTDVFILLDKNPEIRVFSCLFLVFFLKCFHPAPFHPAP